MRETCINLVIAILSDYKIFTQSVTYMKGIHIFINKKSPLNFERYVTHFIFNLTGNYVIKAKLYTLHIISETISRYLSLKNRR